MIQAIGLTSLPRRHQLKPAVDDLTFEARPGRVTVLLGSDGSGKTTALRLMLQLQAGRGTALFRGRPVTRIQHLAREVGVLLGDVNGHPGRTARSHLRMLAAAAGVPAGRADDVLDVVGLSGLADQRMSALSRGMDRRLGVACALLGDPHTLILDEPAHGLSPRETAWLYSLLRGYANLGGTVLATSHRSDEAAELADRVVSIDAGRLVADQDAADFVRTRLRPRVAVRTPHAERLVAVLTQEGRKAGRERDSGPLKVVREGGTRVSVYGSSCAEVGEWAYRNGILVHQLTDESGDTGDSHTPGPLDRADGRRTARTPGSSVLMAAEPASTQAAEQTGDPGPDPVKAPAPAADSDQDPGPDPDPRQSPASSAADAAEAAPAAEDVLQELEEIEEFEDDPAAAAESATDHTAPDSRPAAMSSEPEQPEQSERSEQPKPKPEPEQPSVATTVVADEAEPADDEPEPEPVLVTSSAPTAPTAPSASAAAAPATAKSGATTTARAASPSEPVSAKATSQAGTTLANGPSDDAAAPESTASEAPTVRISDGPLDAPSAPSAVLMKPLADPDAPRKSGQPGKPKSPWTPSRPPEGAAAELPPQLHAVAPPGPAAPLRYELCRLFSVRSTWIAMAVSVVAALCISLVMARSGMGLPAGAGSLTPTVRLLAGWPAGGVFLLPPAAVAAGLLGAFAFGEEFRYPALAPARSPASRRLSLLSAKLAVSATLAVLLSIAVAVVNAAGVTLFFGSEALALPSDVPSAGEGSWQLHIAAVFAFAAGCSWAGVLAAGIFRSGAVGTAVVVAVPLLLAPVVRALLGDASGPGRSADGLPGRLEAALLVPWPPGAERWVAALLDLASQPVGSALALSLAALLAGYLVSSLSTRAR